MFSEGARRQAVGDELRKTVPCSRSRDGESTVSDRSSSCNRNYQGRRRCRPQTTARGYSDRLDNVL